MSYKLYVKECWWNRTNHGYTLQWYNIEEGESGGLLGEGYLDRNTSRAWRRWTDEKIAKDPDWDIIVACRLGLQQGWETQSGGFKFETHSAAQEALRRIKLAWKAFNEGTVWPDWAKQAAAAGWKPPKGWRP